MRNWAWLFLFFIGVGLVGCGKDASIRLTRPEVEPPRTKRVHFSLTTAEEVPVSAVVAMPAQTIEMASAGQRSFDAPIGDNLSVVVNVPEGYEVKDWNVVPGGNTDFDSRNPSITVKNIQEDIRISAVVHRIPPKKVNTQKIYFAIATKDEGDIVAVFGKKIEKFQGAGQRVLEIPTGDDLNTHLRLPVGWEIEKWELSEGGDVDSLTKPELLVTNVREGMKITAHIRKRPELTLQVRVKGKSHFLWQPGGGSVKYKIIPAGERLPEAWSPFGEGGQVTTLEDAIKDTGVMKFKAGSTVMLWVDFYDAKKTNWSFPHNIVLDDDLTIDFDFTKFAEIEWKSGMQAYEVIGTPKKAGLPK